MVEKLFMNCPNCGSDENKKVKPYSGVHPVFQKMGLLECNECVLVFAAPQPTEDELKQYYSNYWDGSVAVSKPSTRRYYLAQSVSRVQYLSSYMKDGDLDVLDVGAGLGLFESGLNSCNIKSNYVAVEPDNQQFEKIRTRFGSDNVFLELRDVPNGRKFDLIVLSHVLEHVKNPHEFIDSLIPFLKANGLLFVEVPNRDYRYKDNVESHLLFFNPTSMTKTLEQHGEVLDVCTVGKIASSLRIKNTMPQHGFVQLSKEAVKYFIALATPNLLKKDISRYEMNQYGDDRQWLRAVVKKKS